MHCQDNDRTQRNLFARNARLLFVLVCITGCGAGPSVDKSVTSDAATASQVPTPAVTPPSAPVTGDQWMYSSDEDEMTGKVSHIASVSSDNTVEFGFPYQGEQHGLLSIRRHPRFGSDVIFRIERGQLLCPSYDGCSVLVRFDDGEPLSFSATPAADQSTETIFISNYDRFLSKMRTARRVRIAPKIYQQGNVVFTFDVSDFDSKKFRGE